MTTSTKRTIGPAELPRGYRSHGRFPFAWAAMALVGLGFSSPTPGFAAGRLLPLSASSASSVPATSDRMVSVIVKLKDAPSRRTAAASRGWPR